MYELMVVKASKREYGKAGMLEQPVQLNFCDWGHVQAEISNKINHYIIILLF